MGMKILPTIRLNTYSKNLNQISLKKDVFFCSSRYTAKQLAERIGAENFPSEKIFNEFSTSEAREHSLYDVHTAYYAGLLEAETLDEAKEKYPEFEDVVDAKDIKEKHRVLEDVKKGKYAGFTLENLSLEILKRQYGMLFSIAHKEVYSGLSRETPSFCSISTVFMFLRFLVALSRITSRIVSIGIPTNGAT